MLNVLLNLTLFAVKFIGGKLSNSVSVISDAFNNLTDAVTTMLAWVGLKVSSLGAGENHPNGHGRFEWIIALLSAISVILIGWELLGSSINAIKNPNDTVFGVFTIVVLALSIGVKAFMYVYNNQKSKANNSASLKAIAVDCLSDAASTTVVLVSLIVNALFHVNIDGWCGILVSLFIMVNGFKSFMETAERIMGRSASKEQLEEMRAFAMEDECFSDITDLQIEDYGFGRYRVSMTAIGREGVGADLLLADVMNLKYRIYQKFGYNAQITAERNAPGRDEVNDYISDVLSHMKVPLTIMSLRTCDARDFMLVQLDLGISIMDNRSKMELEKELAARFADAPQGYRILPRVRLMSGERHGERGRRHKRGKDK